MTGGTYDGTLLGKHLGSSWGPEDPSKNPRESQGTPGKPRESRELLGHHREPQGIPGYLIGLYKNIVGYHRKINGLCRNLRNPS